MKSHVAISFVMLAATSGAALAHSNSARLSEQRDWIEEGRRDGSITWREGLKLRREQAAIARAKADLEADGRLSRSDRRYLYRLQDRAENDIAKESSDGWRRPWWLPRIGR